MLAEAGELIYIGEGTQGKLDLFEGVREVYYFRCVIIALHVLSIYLELRRPCCRYGGGYAGQLREHYGSWQELGEAMEAGLDMELSSAVKVNNLS